MSKIILELQREALDDSKLVSSILRKAFVIARKLEIDEFAEWCEKELNGYDPEKDEKPDYRFTFPVYKAFNPYRGFIPVIIEDKKLLKAISKQFVENSIFVIEEYINHNDSTLRFTINQELQEVFNSMGTLSFEISAFVSKGDYIKIIQRIRTIVLDWTIALEKNGVLGEELEFTASEKDTVQSGIINYGTIINGNVKESTIQRDINDSFNTNNNGPSISEIRSLLSQIEENKDRIDVTSDDMEILNKTIESLRNEIELKLPNPSKISTLFGSIKSIFENTMGSVVASGIIYEIGRLFP